MNRRVRLRSAATEARRETMARDGNERDLPFYAAKSWSTSRSGFLRKGAKMTELRIDAGKAERISRKSCAKKRTYLQPM